MNVLWLQLPLSLSPHFIDYPWFVSLGVWQNAAAAEAHAGKGSVRCVVLDSLTHKGARARMSGGRLRLGISERAFLDEAGGLSKTCEVAVIHLDPFTRERPNDALLIRTVREIRRNHPDIRVILAELHIGGMHRTAGNPALETRLAGETGWVVRGEGEEVLPPLLDALARRQEVKFPSPMAPLPTACPLPPTAALSFPETADPGLIRMLGDLRRIGSRPDPFRLTPTARPLKTSRGCGFSCVFCTSNPGRTEGRRPSWRPAPFPALSREIGRLKANGAESLWILDECANHDPAHLDRLLALAEAHDLRLEFPNGLRADRLKRSQIRRLARLGSLLSLSPESGSERVLKEIIGKGQSPAQVERAAAWAHESGLAVALHFILGLPGETKEDLLQTLRFALRCRERYGARIWWQYAVPLPGSRLFDLLDPAGRPSETRDIGQLFSGQVPPSVPSWVSDPRIQTLLRTLREES